ncbi:MAG: amidase [Propionibacteriaceae bacterium]|jgi:amidase|nr:amidase [Propionibacteriaceae bacterium]
MQTAEQLAAAIRDGETTAVAATEQALSRARERADVGAFVHLADEYALRQAAEIDADLPKYAHLPLVGVPCPVKDLNQVAGLPWECGAAVMKGVIAQVTDGVAQWLRAAGTVMVGKTNTPEFGFPCYTEPDNAPPARTPWDLTRSAGGSSGGAAAAVAAGIVAIAQGSDGGGSIRIPASACGIVGLKPSRGRVSHGPYGVPGPGLTTNGVLTRTVRDTALGLDAIAGPRPGDAFYAPQPAGTFRQACDRDPGKLRVGVLTTPIIAEADVHPACLEAVDKTVALLASLGHDIVPAPVPMEIAQWDAFAALWSVGASSLPVPEDQWPKLRPLTRWLAEQGRKVTGDAYAAALVQAQRIAAQVAERWAGLDAILTPTLAQPPAKIGELRDDADPAADFAAQTRFTPWTSVYNVSGLPAISLPLHTAEVDSVRLPIGVMLGAQFGAEELLLALSAQLESAY